jgi:hypothetical protein
MSVDYPTRSQYRSARNGFVIASLLLAGITVYDLVQSGSYQAAVFGVLIATQIGFWGSRLYYKEQGDSEVD